MEVVDGQSRHGLEQVGLKLRDHILKSVLAEVPQTNESRDTACELDELLLNLLALRLALLLFVREFLLLLLGEIAILGLGLQLFDLVALVDDGLDHVVAKRSEAFDPTNGRHSFLTVGDSPQCVVVHVHEQGALPLASEQRGGGAGHSDVEDAAGVHLSHVGAVVGEDWEERDKVLDGLLGVVLVRRQADAVVGELA